MEARQNQLTHRKSHQKLSWILVMAGMLMAVLAIGLGMLSSKQPAGSIPQELTPWMTYAVVHAYPHDPAAYTQGLIYHEGCLYESTGQYGASSLRKVNLETGVVLQQVDLPQQYFGEGLTLWGDTLLQLTWFEETGFIYALEDFSLLGQFHYPTEGWGLTHDGERLIMSDGSHRLYFLDPEDFQITDNIAVTFQGDPIALINELEYVQGEVYANIWLTDIIIRIDPATGVVKGWIDLGGLLPEELRTPTTNVLNGIAYDPDGNRLFVTGKYWPLLYEICLVPVTTDH